MFDTSAADWIIDRSRRYPLLTADQEIELSRQVQTWLALKDKPNPSASERAAIRRGKRAYDRFFLSNVRMCVALAARYTRRGGNLLYEDLIQEAIVGLQRAIIKFDSTRGYKFSTYAFNWIRQSISRAINSKGKPVRLPEHAYRAMRKASEFIASYENQHGCRPPIDLVATHAEVQVETLKTFLRHTGPVISLDDSVRNAAAGNRDTGSTYLDLIAAEVQAPLLMDELDNLRSMMPRLMSGLKKEQQEVIRRRYLQDKPDTYQQIGNDLKVSRERVRQVHDNSIRQLRFKVNALARPEDIQALRSA
ncbi:MAG: sigma-70 family RNA polymerase sigma factor [Vulcanococcus sp.]